MNHALHESMCRGGCTGLLRRVSVDASPQVRVTLSDDLLCHLRRVAQEKHIPLRWLVAGLVCDTMEAGVEETMNRQAALMGR